MMNIPPATAAPARRQKLCTPSTDVQPPSPAPSPPGYDYYLSTPPDSFSHQRSLARLGSVTESASLIQAARQVRLIDTRQASAPLWMLLVTIVEASIESTCHPSRKLALISCWVTRLGPQSPGWRSLKHSM